MKHICLKSNVIQYSIWTYKNMYYVTLTLITNNYIGPYLQTSTMPKLFTMKQRKVLRLKKKRLLLQRTTNLLVENASMLLKKNNQRMKKKKKRLQLLLLLGQDVDSILGVRILKNFNFWEIFRRYDFDSCFLPVSFCWQLLQMYLIVSKFM